MLLRFASDDRLVEQLRAGSEVAFETIFDRHHRGLLAFCRHMLGSVEEAEDAVQHTFLAAYRDLMGSDKPIQLRPWLYTIARNRCLSVLRAPDRDVHTDFEPPTEQLSAVVERRQDLRDLLVDLARLPDDQRASLVLAEVGGLSHEEIAAVLSCRREKVKALVFQARTALIAGRTARETPCAEVREQLANLTGGALARRHMRDCAGCREYRDQVRAQRLKLGLALPVAPTIGLKGAVLGGAGAAAAGAGGGAGAAATGSLAAKALVAVALAGGGVAVVDTAHERSRAPAERAGTAAPAVKPATSLPVATVVAPAPTAAATPAADTRPGPKATVRRLRAKGRRVGAGAEKRRGPKAKVEKVRGVKETAAKRRGPKAKTKTKVKTPRGPTPNASKPRALDPKPAKPKKERATRDQPRAGRLPPATPEPRSPKRCGPSAGAEAGPCAGGP
jgi:RNA polymerase sigma factor (sigma-70 family)